jgi:thiol-disulfide isomerase/thioredoxin
MTAPAGTSVLPRLAVLAALVVLGGCGGTARRPLSLIPAASAAPLPPLEYRLLDGAPWTSASATGRVLVVDVWATYCKPCRKAFPKLNQLAAAHPEAVVIGLSVDEDDADVRAFLAEIPATYPIARDPAMSVREAPLQLSKLPTLLVVDRRGRVRLQTEKMDDADYDALPGLVAALQAE